MPIVLREPQVVPISDEDYQQAVSALAAMIHNWWLNHRDDEQLEGVAEVHGDGPQADDTRGNATS